jgi:WD40 repeat protein
MKLDGHKTSVGSLAVSSKGDLLASGSEDETVRLWSTVTGEELRCLNLKEPVRAIAFSLCGGLLASAAGTTLRVWDVSTGDVIDIFSIYGTITDLAFAPKRTLVFSLYNTTNLLQWTERQAGLAARWSNAASDASALWDPMAQSMAQFFDKISVGCEVSRFAVSSDGKTIALAHDNTVEYRELYTGATPRFQPHTFKSLIVPDLQFNIVAPRIPPHSFKALGVHDLQLSLNNKLLAVCADRSLKIWQTRTVSKPMGERITRPRGCCVEFHMDRDDQFAVSFLV